MMYQRETERNTLIRISASSLTTFFFLCKYRNSSSSLRHRSAIVHYLICSEMTHRSDELRSYVGHVLTQGGDQPGVVRQEVGPVLRNGGQELF